MIRWLVLLLLVVPAWAFEAPEVNLAFTSPPGWEQRSTGKDGSLVAFSAPKTPAVRSTLDVAVTEMGQVEELRRQDALGVVRHLAGQLENFQLLGSKETRVAGLKAQRITYKARSGKSILQSTQVFTVRNGRLYLFTLTTSPEQHAAHTKVLNAVLESVRWTN